MNEHSTLAIATNVAIPIAGPVRSAHCVRAVSPLLLEPHPLRANHLTCSAEDFMISDIIKN